MDLKTCEFCGTEYNGDQQQCPLCGRAASSTAAAQEARRTVSRGGARVASRKTKKQQDSDRVPQWMWVVICIILAIAVLIGLVYFLVSMDYLGGKEEPTAPSQTVTVPEAEPVNAPELLDPKPEEVEPEQEEPADLSCRALELSQELIILDVEGSSVYLTATPDPIDTTDSLVFNTLDETIAIVDQSGMITAIGHGQTEVLVTCGQVVDSCTVICDLLEEEPEEETPEGEASAEEEPEEVPAPELNTVDFTLFRPGEETTITVKNVPEGAAITFTSSDPDVATISSNGVVKAVGDGTATITVMVGEQKLTCIARCRMDSTTENNEEGNSSAVSGTLKLYNPVGNSEDVTLGSVGESFSLSLVDSNGNKASGVNWSTSNSGVCSVDANGKVTALGSGMATVVATYNGKSYTCIVRCSF